MQYRIELSPQAAAQINGLPAAATRALIEQLSVIIEDPHNPTISDPVSADLRIASFDSFGYVEYQPWGELKVVVVRKVVWVG